MDELMQAFKAEVLGAFRRQADGAAQDMRVIGGMIGSALLTSDDPAKFASLNAGVRVPMTVPQFDLQKAS